jgi:hypothetical protein
MTIRKLGQWSVALGVLGIAFSLLADLLPGAKAGIQSTQILGIEISVAILLVGVWILLSETDDKLEIKEKIHILVEQILNLPVIVWVLAGFLVIYVLFFVSPIFLNDTLRMRYFINYLPDRYPIGNDLITVLDLMKGWFFEEISPYWRGFYPPFTYVFFAPLLLVSDYPALFVFFTLFNVVSYIFLTLLLPTKMTEQGNFSMILLFFLTGLISYGFQFELERGQYNVFTFLLCLLAIYIFHYHRKYRILSYLLFSFSIQLKLYPAIFIVMFVDNWVDWKTVIRRFAGIGTFNFLLLFIMGNQIFLDFVQMVFTQIAVPSQRWNGNHSISSFVGTLAIDGFGVIPPDALVVLRQNSGVLSTFLLLMVLASFISAILIFHLRREQGLDPYLLLVCTIGALTIPISNDYTLSILAAPIAIFLSSISGLMNSRNRFASILLILGISIAYASTLIPFKYKPHVLNNIFPALFFILVFVTILNFIRYRNSKQQTIVQ